MSSTQFLPKDYEAPSREGNYMKFQDGVNRFRIMGESIVGWVYWRIVDGKRAPVRMEEAPESTPDDIAPDSKVKHFWAFPVWNYEAEKIQILEVTQSTIQDAIRGFVDDSDWGDPTGYDLKIKRSGKDLDTKYTISTAPAGDVTEEVAKEYKDISINLEALYDNEDPFEVESGDKEDAVATPAV